MTDENDSTAFDLRALQKRVGEWHREMFPDLPSPLRILERPPATRDEFGILREDDFGSCLRDEVRELLVAEPLNAGRSVEAADVVLCVLAYCDRRGVDLASALERKFEINRGRSRERVRR